MELERRNNLSLPTTSPRDLLADLNAAEAKRPRLILITGPPGAGKTRWCRALRAAARDARYPVRGVLSVAVFYEERKVAIDLVDAAGGERRRLAVLRAWPSGIPLSLTLSQGNGDIVPATGRWQFDPATLAWGNHLLQQAGDGDVLIVDEIGPLEFKQGRGFQAGLAALDRGDYRLGCATVRPSLLAMARSRWPGSQIIHLPREETTTA